MNRLISVLVTLFLLFLVYLWISHITGDNTPVAEPETLEEEAIDPEPDTPAEALPPPVEQESSEEQANDAPAVTESDPPKREEPVQAASEAPRGAHMVIAGNFLERANANKHLQAIKGLGFANAEILEFEISEYYTVCAGRYNDLSEARSAVRRIKELPGMDAYVRNSN